MDNTNNRNYLAGFMGLIIGYTQQEKLKLSETPYNDDIEFSPIVLTDEYAKKWNERSSDFFKIYKDGVPVSEKIYRQGGLFNKNDLNQPYFQIIRYSEALHDRKTFPKHTTEQLRHLKPTWVIIDSKTGEEVYEFANSLDNGRIFKNSILCSYKNSIFNIKSGEKLVENLSVSSLESSEFLFVDNSFDTDKSKRGVYKIHKMTAEIEVFQK
jgi:hypothetical protein